jgi:hypothetical protein
MSAEYEVGMIASGFFTGGARIIWVGKDGSDTTGNGTLALPFLTINRACTAIRALGNASDTIRYAIFVGPGRFTESIVMSDWTWVTGVSTEATRVTFSSWAFGPEWDANVQHKCGLQSMTVSGGGPVDFAAATSEQGKISFVNVWFADAWTFTAFTASNLVILANCGMNGFVQNGFSEFHVMNSSSLNPSVYVVNATASLAAYLSAKASMFGGTLTMNSSGASTSNLGWYDSSLNGMLTLNGAAASVTADSSLRNFVGGVTLTGGAPDPRFALTGAKAGNAALASVCTQLAASGGYVDTTT